MMSLTMYNQMHRRANSWQQTTNTNYKYITTRI